MFGYESDARLYVWVSKRNYDLINMLREEIVKKQGEYIGEIDSRPCNQYIVRQEVKQFLPEELDDLAARKLAREIANRIQEELRYPGEIKVTVIRESRVIEYAK